jgi:hypothetical protein
MMNTSKEKARQILPQLITVQSPDPHSHLQFETTLCHPASTALPSTPCPKTEPDIPSEYLTTNPCLQSHPCEPHLPRHLFNRDRALASSRIPTQNSRCIRRVSWVAFVGNQDRKQLRCSSTTSERDVRWRSSEHDRTKFVEGLGRGGGFSRETVGRY